MAASEGGGKGGVKEGEAMMANKIAGSVGSVPAMCFKVLKGDPVGKTVHWVFQSEDFKHEIARGDFVIREVGPDGMVAMPLNKYVNAGVYAFCFCIDDDSLSMREMR